MNAPARQSIGDLVDTCATATDSDDLLGSALPMLVALGAARGAAVTRRTGDGEAVVVQRAGVDVSAAADRRALPDGLGTLCLEGPGDDAQIALALLEGALARITARSELADLTARMNVAQQLADMGDYDWHIATDTNQWSDQLYRIYGHEPQSFNPTYERFLAQIHRDDRDRIRAIHEHAYATGEPYQMIERIVRPNGEVRYLSSNGQVIRDDAGTPIRMRGTCLDITDRVLAQQAQDRVAARFRSLVETFPDAIVVLDGTDRIVQANRHATELLGADPVGRHIGEILPTPPVRGDAVPGTRLDGRAVQLDVRTSALSPEADDAAVAIFLRDAAPRLAGEAMAATLREAQVRRRQALEINDNIVQGLTVALNAVEQHNGPAAGVYLERTLAAARQLMNDWLDPLTGADLQPGDLVRSQPSVLADPPPKHLPTARPLRVLIADDYDAVRGLLRRQLDQMDGYEFAGEAADGEEAVRLATILQPDVVILDLAMPVLDGLQATPLICAAVPGVRVIVLSGFDERTMAQKVLAAGAARYVEKGLRMNLSEILGDVGANA